VTLIGYTMMQYLQPGTMMYAVMARSLPSDSELAPSL